MSACCACFRIGGRAAQARAPARFPLCARAGRATEGGFGWLGHAMRSESFCRSSSVFELAERTTSRTTLLHVVDDELEDLLAAIQVGRGWCLSGVRAWLVVLSCLLSPFVVSRAVCML
mmetsp:Transcript_55066/g.147204  ORF Transcript_55066/g.147204 Transcript_55066/m.147204 type:complete len:118 (-) Transcript_55066:90-443(-)